MADTITLHVSSAATARLPQDGTDTGPLTLLHAQQEVRRLRQAQPEAPVEVIVHGGTYRLDAPLRFGPEDSGEAGCPVRWQAAAGERPVLSAAAPVEGWKPLDHDLAGLPEAARGNVWYTDFNGEAIRTLYDGDGLLTRASLGPLSTNPEADEQATRTTLFADPADLRAWPHIADLELFIKPLHIWEAQFLTIASLDPRTGVIQTNEPGTYQLIAHGQKNPPAHFWLENVPEGLAEPGRWLLDSANGRLYLWSRKQGEPEGILAPRTTELVVFEADNGGRPCHHIAVEGIAFAHGDRIPWPARRRGIQHDWQVYDWPDAMVRLNGARDIALTDCRFADAGATGLRMDGFAVGNRVEGCTFEALGGNAVAIIGDEPKRRRERTHHNTVRGCRVRDIGRLWWQASGIIVCQAGHNLIADNHLCALPYCGITLVSGREGAFGSGKEDLGFDGKNVPEGAFGDSPRDRMFVVGHLTCRHNVVEGNEIHDVMQRMGDGNGIYVSGTGWGNIVRRNFVHDIPCSGVHSAIRLDDVQFYARIEGNVVCRVSGAGLTLKDVNDVTDNIVVDCQWPASILCRRTPSWGANVKRNIVVVSEPPADLPAAPMPFFSAGGFGGRLEEPNIDDNLLWCPADPRLAEACLEAMQAIGQDLHGVVADPCFVDPANDDYRLRRESPALNLGFRQY